MRPFKALAIIVLCFIFVRCSGDYRPEAVGQFGEAEVVMDSTLWNSRTGNAIRDVYGKGIKTMPQWEPAMDLKFIDFKTNQQLDRVKNHKNIIIAGSINDSSSTSQFIRALLSKKVQQKVKSGQLFAFPFKNQWYKNQWTIVLTSTSDSLLAQKIHQSGNTLRTALINEELNRRQKNMYEKAEQTGIEDSLWTHFGWKIRVPHDWRQSVDTTFTRNGVKNHFFTMRFNLTHNRRWLWAWWIDDTQNIDSLSPGWINAKRDSLMETFVRGTRKKSYITTDYEHYPVSTDTLRLNNLPVYETRGVWRMTHDAMAGPFVNMTIDDRENGRLFLLEFGQFAPKYDKRRFVRQFQAMLRTFKSDSSWTPKNNN